MATPDLNAVDLSAISNPNPTLSSVDLLGGSGVVNRATLRFTASGAGGTTAAGSGSAMLEFVATGIGYRVNSGAGAAGLSLAVAGAGGSGYAGNGSAFLGASARGKGYQDWLSILPPVQLQELYRLIITGEADGLDDLTIGGISSWQATNQAGARSSYVQAVIPAAADLIDGIAARSNGELVIQKGYRFSDGRVRYDEILRSRFDTLRQDQGSVNLTVTVSGFQQDKPVAGGTRTLTGVRSVSESDGKSRARCDIDMFLQPGMAVVAGSKTFTADFINYYVSDVDKFCEVGQR